jgi:hypothetical protein
MVGTHKRPKRFWLQELVAKHEAELVYDLRKLGINPAKVDLDELILIVDVLIRDPESWTHAAVANWKHPISYEWTVLVATYDMMAQVNSRRKPKPYPRPWPDPNVKVKGKPHKDARAILKRARDGDLEWLSKHTPMLP